MKRTKIVSRSIISIGYELQNHLLEVVFSLGNKYVYEYIPEKVYKEFLTSKSKGRYFGKYIRGKYKGTKV